MAMDLVEGFERHPSFADTALVGDDDNVGEEVVQNLECGEDILFELEFIFGVDIVAGFDVDDAVAVEEEGPGGVDEGKGFVDGGHLLGIPDKRVR